MYIKDCVSISPQPTYDNSFFEGEVKTFEGNSYEASEPDYSGLISRGLLRRMGKAVRMGVAAGKTLLQKYPRPDGIILGTANGGLEDCIKFLTQIIEYDEGRLTPTNFVQSTPNSVAGHLALMEGNTAYNTTHVNMGLSFEAALLDAILLLEEEDNGVEQVLAGGLDEITGYNYNIDKLLGFFKENPVPSDRLIDSGTPGTVCGEGAAFFVMEKEPSENAMAEIIDVDQLTAPSGNDVIQNTTALLERNSVHPGDVRDLVLGYSGDAQTDHWYAELENSLFPHASVYSFKNLAGDYPTASSFALWLAAQKLSGKRIPRKAVLKDRTQKPGHVLVYNHYKGDQHGLILLKGLS